MALLGHDFTLDDTLQLNNRTTGNTVNNTIVGATSGGTALVIDLGQQAPQYANLTGATTTPAASVTSAKAYARFAVVVDWTDIQASATQGYYLKVQGSLNDPAFGGNVFELEQRVFGHESLNNQPFATVANGRAVLFCDNQAVTTGGIPQTCRYIRLAVFCSNGGMTTGWNYKAWLVPLS